MTDHVSTARADMLGGAGWAAFGTLVVAESLRMERFTSMGASLYTMPGLVPGILGGLLMLLGAGLGVRGYRRWRLQRGTGADTATPLLNRRIATTLAATLVYAIGLVGRVPFMLATALFVGVFVYVFTPVEATPTRRAVVALLAGSITALVVVLVFERIFLVRLP
jgi:hypothetical protein